MKKLLVLVFLVACGGGSGGESNGLPICPTKGIPVHYETSGVDDKTGLTRAYCSLESGAHIIGCEFISDDLTVRLLCW